MDESVVFSPSETCDGTFALKFNHTAVAAINLTKGVHPNYSGAATILALALGHFCAMYASVQKTLQMNSLSDMLRAIH